MERNSPFEIVKSIPFNTCKGAPPKYVLFRFLILITVVFILVWPLSISPKGRNNSLSAGEERDKVIYLPFILISLTIIRLVSYPFEKSQSSKLFLIIHIQGYI